MRGCFQAMKLGNFTVSLPPGIGMGAALALGLLVGLNLLLLNDGVVHHYGAVFAVGRAMDKQLHVESHPPAVLVVGNSRVDNGVDPTTLRSVWHDRVASFNHGIPGANARVMYGMLKRMDEKGRLGKVRGVLLGLDESFLQADESLGYIYFFGHRPTLLADREYRFWFGSWLRLWSYSDNLRQLREPEKALRFVSATFRPLEPVGGAASRNLGYRKGFGGGGQDEGQVGRQEVLAQHKPDQSVLRALDALLDLLQTRGIPVAVTFPPLLRRQSAYVDPAQSGGAYARLKDELKRRSVSVLDESDPVPRDAAYFVNPGHLNDKGAQIYSAWLAERLRAEWAWLGSGQSE